MGTWMAPDTVQTLNTAGTYKILVEDRYSVNTGSYVVMWQRVKNPCNTGELGCGQTVSGRIGTAAIPPAWRFYTFTGAVNDIVSIRVNYLSGLGFGPGVDLYSPTGAVLSSQVSSIDRTLTQAGTYTILVRDAFKSYPGNYSLKLQKNSNSCAEIVVTAPNGWELLIPGSSFPLTWTCTGGGSINSQEIKLLTDGGIDLSECRGFGASGGQSLVQLDRSIRYHDNARPYPYLGDEYHRTHGI